MPEHFEPWLSFKQPIVRQLAFSLASPNIIKSIPQQLDRVHAFDLHDDAFWIEQFQRYQARLDTLDQDPTELLNFLSQLKSTRLGLRFEHLLWFWLLDENYHHFKLIGHSIQIIEDKNTLGELDFLIFNQQSLAIEHWEVAIKFYLAENDLSLEHWYGLNRTDTLYRKLNHFSQKQFQFESALQHQIQTRYVVLKGQLYLPDLPADHRQQQHLSLAAWINPTRRIGTWGSQILPQYYRLERQEWICPHQSQSSPHAMWWYNGLYRHLQRQHDYMFRATSVVAPSLKII